MIRFTTIIMILKFAVLASSLLGEDRPTPPLIAASSDVKGTGKRSDPFVFDQSTKCVLKITGAMDMVEWDLEDAPASTEVIDRIVIFSLSDPGDYLIIAHGPSMYAKCWFRVKGPNGPPAPVSPISTIPTKLKASLVGPDVKTDANKLAGLVSATADALQAGQYQSMKELNAAWKAGQAATQWPANKYVGMPDIIRLAIPPVDEKTVISPAMRVEFVAALRVIEKTAKEVANG